MSCVIHWFRRDLRLSDNLALRAALATGDAVVTLFIFDPKLIESERFSAARLKFMLAGLRALDQSLQEYGTRLLIRHGDPAKVLPRVIAATGATALYYNRDYTPYAVKRDAAITKSLHIPAHAYDDAMLHAPDAIQTNDSRPYTVYTPYKRRWLDLPKPAVATGAIPNRCFHDLNEIDNQPIPHIDDFVSGAVIDVPEAGEKIARQRLDRFMARGIFAYGEGRNQLEINPFTSDDPSTSGLSPYFRFGMISPRQAYHAALRARHDAEHESQRDSIDVWVSELAWREFYMSILYHFPRALNTSFRAEYESVAYRHAPDELERWQQGQTGYPIVDAAMRQMNQIGWMHNRARMIVASFLTKDLLIYWREGDVYFMSQLIDGDPAANNGGWQWAAGTGTDAQPYFRIFNPVSQSKQFDPSGAYIRHFVPELRDIPDQHIHAPWEMDSPPRAYPAPVVDHKFARERTLNAFKTLKTKEAV